MYTEEEPAQHMKARKERETGGGKRRETKISSPMTIRFSNELYLLKPSSSDAMGWGTSLQHPSFTRGKNTLIIYSRVRGKVSFEICPEYWVLINKVFSSKDIILSKTN